MRNLSGDLSADAHALLDTHVRVPTRRKTATTGTPIGPGAQWVVTVDGAPHAGFGSRRAAEEAMEAWRDGWPGARGKELAVVPARGAAR